MSTRASLIYPPDGQGSWGFYLELLDDTVHFEINTAGVSIDIELMPISQWQELGFPNRFSAPEIVSTPLKKGLLIPRVRKNLSGGRAHRHK